VALAGSLERGLVVVELVQAVLPHPFENVTMASWLLKP
jgi:hypothetical protein